LGCIICIHIENRTNCYFFSPKNVFTKNSRKKLENILADLKIIGGRSFCLELQSVTE